MLNKRSKAKTRAREKRANVYIHYTLHTHTMWLKWLVKLKMNVCVLQTTEKKEAAVTAVDEEMGQVTVAVFQITQGASLCAMLEREAE